MPPASPLWPYFHHNKTHYKTDRTHLTPLSNSTDDVNLDAEDMNFQEYAEDLIRQAQISQQDDTDTDFPIHLSISEPTQPQARTAAALSSSSLNTSKTQIKLANLFNYGLDRTAGEGLELYWLGSVQNLEGELLAYERAAAEATTPTSTLSTS